MEVKTPPLAFVLDDLRDPRIARFLEEHLADMRRVTPPESVYALDLERLRQPGIRFFSAWADGGRTLAGTGALKQLTEFFKLGLKRHVRSQVAGVNSHRGVHPGIPAGLPDNLFGIVRVGCDIYDVPCRLWHYPGKQGVGAAGVFCGKARVGIVCVDVEKPRRATIFHDFFHYSVFWLIIFHL